MATRVFPETNPRGSGTADTVAYYVAVIGGGWLTYRLGVQGTFGTGFQKAMMQIQQTLKGSPLSGLAPTAPANKDIKPVPGPTGAPKPSPAPLPTQGGGAGPGYVEMGGGIAWVLVGGNAGNENDWVPVDNAGKSVGQWGWVETDERGGTYVVIDPNNVGSDAGWARLHGAGY